MKSLMEEFARRTQALLSEPGILERRPAWPVVKAGAISLAPFADSVVTELKPDHALIFILALANVGSKRDLLLKALFKRMLTIVPSDDFVRLLSKLSQAELKDNLLPYIYETGNRGAIACYLAAKLQVYLAPEAFQYFLNARIWHQTDLMNLCLLVKPEESKALCAHIESVIPMVEHPHIKEGYTEFRNILFNHLACEPVHPEVDETQTEKSPVSPAQLLASKPTPLHEPSTKHEKPVDKTSEPNKIPIARQPEPEKVAAKDNRPAASDSQAQTKASRSLNISLQESQTKLIIPLGVIGLLFTGCLFYFSWYYSDPLAMPNTPPKNARAPQQWIDSVSMRPVTAKFLSADKDYRMGELFLTRDKFAEALKLFEDALTIDPDHLQALMRSGYCRLKLGDNKAAAEIFRRVLKKNSGIDSVNLYLARISMTENNLEAAEQHYRAEYALRNDLPVGLELANFLAKTGNQNDAMELIAALQEKNPGKMLVLSTEAETKPEQGGEQP
ncbi:MAG TPA: tetratricopeptide repeat protein [Candidatus Rifleibacterium sp.]|nr:tetratricopeptide repeat protein [Candidatus Rifleibacterium sp.]